MGYYTGAANDMSALRQALVDACVAEGWSWSGSDNVLHNAAQGLYVQISVETKYLRFLGRTSLSAGSAPATVGLGELQTMAGQPTYEVTWPATYHVFVFAQEVFLVVNYNVDRYQWAAFGKSTINGLPGSGMWISAILGSVNSTDSDGPFLITPVAGGGNSTGQRCMSGALGWSTVSTNTSTASRNTFLHSDLDSQGWLLAQTLNAAPVGIAAAAPLIGLSPNSWNSESALLPIRIWKVRPEGKISLTAELLNARHVRIDNYVPGDIISFGPDRWMILPWHKKNILARDGGVEVDHTGTFGWAIRYEGP